MPRKNAASAVALAIAPVPVTPPESAPSPVVARKRARRVAPLPLPVPPPPAPLAIDLAKMSADAAKKALTAAYPSHVDGKRLDATPATEAAALEYLNARDASQIAEGHKEAAGNTLRLAMGDAEAIVGDGWEATWKTQKNEIDWGALAKELAIPSETIERFRKPQKRVLNVREKAE